MVNQQRDLSQHSANPTRHFPEVISVQIDGGSENVNETVFALLQEQTHGDIIQVGTVMIFYLTLKL